MHASHWFCGMHLQLRCIRSHHGDNATARGAARLYDRLPHGPILNEPRACPTSIAKADKRSTSVPACRTCNPAAVSTRTTPKSRPAATLVVKPARTADSTSWASRLEGLTKPPPEVTVICTESPATNCRPVTFAGHDSSPSRPGFFTIEAFNPSWPP